MVDGNDYDNDDDEGSGHDKDDDDGRHNDGKGQQGDGQRNHGDGRYDNAAHHICFMIKSEREQWIHDVSGLLEYYILCA